MTDQPTEPLPDMASGSTANPTANQTGATSGKPPTFEERMEGFGRRAGEAGEKLGRDAEVAGKRLASDPGVVSAADTAARVWGLILLGVGVWFFADITLGMDMPRVPWRDLWPVALIVIGLAVILRGMARRRA